MRRKKRQHKITTAVHSIERALQSVFSSRAVTRIQRIWALLESTYILWLMASTEYRMSRGVFNVRTQIVGRHRVYYVPSGGGGGKTKMANGKWHRTKDCQMDVHASPRAPPSPLTPPLVAQTTSVTQQQRVVRQSRSGPKKQPNRLAVFRVGKQRERRKEANDIA